jgi:hypothetical protein
MKAHIEKYKNMLDGKIILNVVVGILVTLCLAKAVVAAGFLLGLGGHRYEGKRHMMRGGEKMNMMERGGSMDADEDDVMTQ